MKRPSDQAKLLFFAFLRSTVSAIATSESKVGVVPFSTGVTSLSHHNRHLPLQVHLQQQKQQQQQQVQSQQSQHEQQLQHQHDNSLANLAQGSSQGVSLAGMPQITLRLARRTDVPSIQRCNLATLPENYNQQFYSNHLRDWPELVLVAECVDNSVTNGADSARAPHYQGTSAKATISELYNAFPGQGSAQPEPNIVAYVLGKVEERQRPVSVLDDEEAFRENPYSTRSQSTSYITERLGHVTSLAVSEDFRRQGLARDLMLQLHYHLMASYSVDSVGLHVRQSNIAAAGLYNGFGYEETECIPNYYQDGEDAYFMKKRLSAAAVMGELNKNKSNNGNSNNGQGHQQQNLNGHHGFFRSLRRAKPWETGPDGLKLPRSVGRRAAAEERAERERLEQEEEETSSTPELLTGTSW
jgi:ribosomal protein S18 acetylase RimI-like enzyme